MKFESIFLIGEDLKISKLNGSSISPYLSVDDFLKANPSWATAWNDHGHQFLMTYTNTQQIIEFQNPTGGAAWEIKSEPFIGGRPDHRKW